MKKFKQYFKAATNPTTREEWQDWWERKSPSQLINTAAAMEIIDNLYKVAKTATRFEGDRNAEHVYMFDVGYNQYVMIYDIYGKEWWIVPELPQSYREMQHVRKVIAR